MNLEGIPEAVFLSDVRADPYSLLEGARRWRAGGVSDSEIAERYPTIAALVNDRTRGILLQRISAGFASCSVPAMAMILTPNSKWRRELGSVEFYKVITRAH